jgi:hypothetical protein
MILSVASGGVYASRHELVCGFAGFDYGVARQVTVFLFWLMAMPSM